MTSRRWPALLGASLVLFVSQIVLPAAPAASTEAGAGGPCPLFVPAAVGANDRFGSSIGLDGNSLAAGSWLADEFDLRDAGSVTTFELPEDAFVEGALADAVTATETQRLVSSNPQPAAHFGFSVDLDGDVLVIGAAAETVETVDGPVAEAGAVYVFERPSVAEPWLEVARLVADDPAAEDSFGYSVEVDGIGGSIVIGAQNDDVEIDDANITDAGSAYLFSRDVDGVWSQETKLVDPAAKSGDRAGHDVALSGPWVVVGHHLDDQVGNRTVNNAGGALLYERTETGFSGPLELTGSAPAPRDRAGIGVDVDGQLLVMTSWSQQPGDRSAIWIFRHDGSEWGEEVRIEVDDSLSGDSANSGGGTQFGRHVELADGVIAVGAAGDGISAPGGGAVHYFGQQAGEWVRLARTAPHDIGPDAQAGISLGLSSSWAAIGAERAQLGVRNSGGVCVMPVAALIASSSAAEDPAVEVVVDAGEIPPALAEPLAAGPLQRFNPSDNNTTRLLMIGAALAAATIAGSVLLLRVRGRGTPQRR